ncbi:MAG TPA: PIN domain-containing protein [Ignavibacteriaceae bacterium]|nr:PIN domain-containing protein [Ignavibacteriaceae bacterium]
MKIIDANIVLRYLLKDDITLHKKALSVLENNDLFVPNEIVAEIVYVLEKVYSIPKKEIAAVLCLFFLRENLSFLDLQLILNSLQIYMQYNIDYADALLVSYKKTNSDEIFSFDKKLVKILEKI